MTLNKLLGVYIDGETKAGKGAASQAVATALSSKGLRVYYDVAGDFYRRYVALVRNELGLSEEDVLPNGKPLEEAARIVYESKKAFDKDASLGDLQRPSIGKSVSILGELDIAQRAGSEWFAMSAERAKITKSDAIVLDGRNTRMRLSETGIAVNTVLELIMTCDPTEAALRTLISNGNKNPTKQQIDNERLNVINRRERDRLRPINPFVMPSYSVLYSPDRDYSTVLKEAWEERPVLFFGFARSSGV